VPFASAEAVCVAAGAIADVESGVAIVGSGAGVLAEVVAAITGVEVVASAAFDATSFVSTGGCVSAVAGVSEDVPSVDCACDAASVLVAEELDVAIVVYVASSDVAAGVTSLVGTGDAPSYGSAVSGGVAPTVLSVTGVEEVALASVTGRATDAGSPPIVSSTTGRLANGSGCFAGVFLAGGSSE